MNLPLEYGKWVRAVVGAVINDNAIATAYLSPTLTIRARRVTWKRKRPGKRDRTANIALTIGAPNYLARRFIKACQKAGEPFPVKKIQVKAWP